MGFCILSGDVVALLAPLGHHCCSSKWRKLSASRVGPVPRPGEKETVEGKGTDGTWHLLLLKNQGEKGHLVHDIKAPSTDSHLD